MRKQYRYKCRYCGDEFKEFGVKKTIMGTEIDTQSNQIKCRECGNFLKREEGIEVNTANKLLNR